MKSWEVVADWLGENETLVVSLSAFGAAVAGAGIGHTWGTRWVLFWLLILAVFVLAPAVGTRRNRLQQGRRAAADAVRKMLETTARAYGFPTIHVRANIMKFTPDRQRRKVDAATAFNMENDPDCDLQIHSTAGVSGEAVTHRKPAMGDLSVALSPTGPSWGLTAGEKAKVRPTLKSILSVPIFDPDDPAGDLLGTMQIDSDEPIETVGFDRADRRELAERFADVVSLLLKTGN